MTARIAALAIYPVKAGRRVELSVSALGPTGLDGDREWMVIRPDGKFLSQRTHPALARLAAERVPSGIVLRFPGLEPLPVDGTAAGESRAVTVWDDHMTAIDAGEGAAAWLARALGEPVRLVRVGALTRRHAEREWVGERDVPVSFSDGFPILVCSTSSLAALNARLPEPVPMNRFRPNIVIDGLEPFAEDRIRTLRSGSVELTLVKPCTRCTVPAVDQDRGERATDPGPALRAFRFDKQLRGVLFGMNAVAAAPPGARLEVGAPLEVLG